MTEVDAVVGLDGFTSALAALEVDVEQEGALLVYRVMPLRGSAMGQSTETAVEAAELAGWPRVGPHWIHTPGGLSLPGGSSQPSTRPGWTRYSRPHPGRLDVHPTPARLWLAHVTAFLGTAA